MMVMDRRPFPELADIVGGFKDPRIKIWAEKIGEEFSAKMADGSWSPKYHDDLYILTDQAIKGGSPEAACSVGQVLI